jgi:ribosomal-protein-alanine N-acetyltransferase
MTRDRASAPSAWRIREMSPGDRAAVAIIAVASGSTLDVDAELGRSWARCWVAHDPDGHGWVVGFLVAWSVADELHLIDVATHVDFRRRGVASCLLARLLHHACSQHARVVLLEVRRSNRAGIDLYRRHGFRTMRVRAGYYTDGDEDAIEMQLDLDADGQVLQLPDELLIEES